MYLAPKMRLTTTVKSPSESIKATDFLVGCKSENPPLYVCTMCSLIISHNIWVLLDFDLALFNPQPAGPGSTKWHFVDNELGRGGDSLIGRPHDGCAHRGKISFLPRLRVQRYSSPQSGCFVLARENL